MTGSFPCSSPAQVNTSANEQGNGESSPRFPQEMGAPPCVDTAPISSLGHARQTSGAVLHGNAQDGAGSFALKFCGHCAARLIRADGEESGPWNRRKYCNEACRNAFFNGSRHAAEKVEAFPSGFPIPVDAGQEKRLYAGRRYDDPAPRSADIADSNQSKREQHG